MTAALLGVDHSNQKLIYSHVKKILTPHNTRKQIFINYQKEVCLSFVEPTKFEDA